MGTPVQQQKSDRHYPVGPGPAADQTNIVVNSAENAKEARPKGRPVPEEKNRRRQELQARFTYQKKHKIGGADGAHH